MALTKTVDRNDQPYPRDVALLTKKVDELQAAVEALTTLANAIKADHNTHVHGGVTAGAASTAVPTTLTTAGSVVL